MGLFAWVVIGLIAGAVARIFVPTGRHLGCLGTIVLGIVGSIVGGTIASVARGDGFDLASSGLIGSSLGAVVVLVIVRFVDSK